VFAYAFCSLAALTSGYAFAGSETPKGVTEGCSGFSGLSGLWSALSKLQGEHLVK
jgi:hypothetical protein